MRLLARAVIEKGGLLQKQAILNALRSSYCTFNHFQGSAPPALQPQEHAHGGQDRFSFPPLHTRPYASGRAANQFESTSVEVGGKTISFETGQVAKLADGSCVLRQGSLTVLATAVGGNDMVEGEDPATLQVSFREPLYGAGNIPLSKHRRERGSGTERETLVSRAIDRSLRPLLVSGYHYPVDVHAKVLSQDSDSMDPDAAAINAASLACLLSNVPWNGPVGAVRVARVDGEFVVNPALSVLARAEMDVLVAGTDSYVLMLEMNGAQAPEHIVAEALHLAQTELRPLVAAQLDLAAKCGRQKRQAPLFEVPQSALEQLADLLEPLLKPVLRQGGEMSKAQRGAAQEAAKAQGWIQASSSLPAWSGSRQQHLHGDGLQSSDSTLSVIEGRGDALQAAASQEQQQPSLSYAHYVAAFSTVMSRTMRAMILDEGLRPDGRQQHQIRPLLAKGAYLPPGVIHGSALFSRGETQALCIATVDNSEKVLSVESPLGQRDKAFMLHYSFPPFCTNEVDQLREPSRREVGHGALAERALKPVMPTLEQDGWPFCTRVNSETLASNGSSSMAAVCGGTLALLMAGVPIKNPVAGISIGLVTEDSNDNWDAKRFALLTDIAGAEDSLGDMDFKIAGSQEGVTAMQLDMKLPGIPVEVLVSAMAQARAARLEVLSVMEAAVVEQHGEQRRVEEMQIDKDCLLLLRGEKGKALAALQQSSGAKVVLNDEGIVQIYAPSKAKMSAACAAVKAVQGSDLEEGKVYPAQVSQLFDWGAVITLPSGAKHVLHISEMAHGKVQSSTSLLQVGDDIQVKYLGRDIRGMLRLSRKACLPSAPSSEAE